MTKILRRGSPEANFERGRAEGFILEDDGMTEDNHDQRQSLEEILRNVGESIPAEDKIFGAPNRKHDDDDDETQADQQAAIADEREPAVDVERVKAQPAVAQAADPIAPDIGALMAQAMKEAAEAACQAIEKATDTMLTTANELKKESEAQCFAIRESAERTGIKCVMFTQMAKVVRDNAKVQQEKVNNFMREVLDNGS